MSGDSSEQMQYLNEQLREKDSEVDELRGKCSVLAEQAAKAQDELALFKETTAQDSAKASDSHQKELSALEGQVENLVSTDTHTELVHVHMYIRMYVPCMWCFRYSYTFT